MTHKHTFLSIKHIATFSFINLIVIIQLNAQMDSLLNEFKALKDPSSVSAVFKQMSKICDFKRSCFNGLENYLFEAPANDVKIQGIFFYASHFANKSIYEIGDELFTKGIRIVKKTDPNHKMLGRFYISIANNFKSKYMLDSALYYADKGYREFEKHKLKNYYWMPYKIRYLVYLDLKDYKRADENLIKAYENADPTNRMDKGFLLHSLLMAKKERGPQSDFEKYLDEYILFKKAGLKDKPVDAEHMGLLSFFDSKEEAIKVLEERLKKLEAVNEVDISLSRLVLANKYEQSNKNDKALAQLEKLESEGSALTNKGLYWSRYILHKKLNNHEQAYVAIEKYLNLQDSTYSQILNSKIAEYEAKFNTKEKEKEIILKDKQLAQVQTAQRTSTGIFLIITILGASLFYIFKKKQKYNQAMTDKDLTIKEQKIKELEQENKLLSLNSMIEGQESERIRIAQDLHDGLGGMLTTVKAHFNTIQKEIESIESINIYAKTNKLIDEACTEVRRIAHDMVPYSIKISGLNGALEDLRESVIARGLNCEMEIHNFPNEKISEQKANMIYRILQELTNNAVKHAKASKIFIQLMVHENKLHIMVEDDGIGFDANKIEHHGLGLRSIQSRVAYLGGSIMFDSSSGHGTHINIEIQL